MCLLLVLLAGGCSAEEAILTVGDRTQLFLDARFVQSPAGIRWTMNPPAKQGMVVRPDQPWDAGWISGAGTVLEDGGKLRMWYTGMPVSEKFTSFHLCYAESDDGIHWRKPNLGLVEWRGSKSNNILMETSIENGGGIFLDPKAPAGERYKLLAIVDAQQPRAPQGPGLYIYVSPDGLRWKLHPVRVFPFIPDTVNQVFYDERIDRYVAFVRVWDPLRKVGRIEIEKVMEPWPYDKSAPQVRAWKRPEHPPGREVPTAFGYDAGDPSGSDHYTSAAVKYSWAEDAYLMFPSPYLHYPDPPKSKHRNDGPLDIQMAVSRDGKKFDRVERLPYVELGMDDEPDCGSLYMFIGMLRRNNWLYQYYGGVTHTHGAYTGYSALRGIGGVFLARQRLDGFVSVDAGMSGASFRTPPLRFSGGKLLLNMNASAMGEVLVELQDREGTPLPGYSFADCDAMHQNHARQVVTWKGASDVQALAVRPVRIAFRLRSVKLFAFQFVP